MSKPFCISCGKAMEKIAIGVNVAFFAKVVGNERPYEVFGADVHQCPQCKTKIVAQYAPQPFWRHHSTEPVPQIDYAVWEK